MAFYANFAYEASAGSGKTFALVIRYISLLYMGAKPESILALTFTNKAANEMSARISTVLKELHLESRKAELSEIAKTIEVDEETLLVMRESILRILDRTAPKKIIVVSSAPQIRYPDCYGIDMAKMGHFIAFEAAIALLKETGQEAVIDEVYRTAKAQLTLPDKKQRNVIKKIYAPFSYDDISKKIMQLLRPPDIRAEVSFVYQTVSKLHIASPHHTGDWYFTGDYPTPGGNRVVNQSFVNYYEGSNARAY